MARPGTAPARGVAVVTGAAGGLGQAIAAELSHRGYTICHADLTAAPTRRPDPVAAPTPQLDPDPTGDDEARSGPGGGDWWVALDVRDEAACIALAQAAAAQDGGLAVWVNNAGILPTGPVWTHDAATRRAVMEVNALGAMNGTLAALAVMRAAGRGHIVNVVSLAGLVAAPGEAVYGASKHALLAFSLGTLAELRAAGERSVDISCICPDGIWTPMLFDKLDDAGAAASFTGTLLSPERVARRVGRLVEHPRPVVALPRWRGGLVRLFDAFPRASTPLAGVMLAVGRAGQRRQRRRLERTQASTARSG